LFSFKTILHWLQTIIKTHRKQIQPTVVIYSFWVLQQKKIKIKFLTDSFLIKIKDEHTLKHIRVKKSFFVAFDIKSFLKYFTKNKKKI